MAMQSLTGSPNLQGGHDCGCGGNCGGTCGGLECLEQPNFFCGQLLTDQDLTALVKWTKGRLELSRYRDGWGVVCGLQVSCDPLRCGWVTLSPGYAVACGGEDILVCREQSIDLTEFCAQAPDPCAGRLPSGESHTPDEYAYFRGCKYKPSELRTVDIMLSYKDELSSPQSAFGRSVCKQVGECEYGRTRETYTITPQLVVGNAPPGDDDAVDFARRYMDCASVIAEFNRRYNWDGHEPLFNDVQGWLMNWVQNHPPSSFCCLKERICALKEPQPILGTPTTDEFSKMTQAEMDKWKQAQGDSARAHHEQVVALQAEIADILFWIVQDCRNAMTVCKCGSCAPDSAVRVARVWLRAGKDSTGAACCCVLGIENQVPYRRHISADCWPTPHGFLNTGRLIWRDKKEAGAYLASHGVRVTWSAFTPPANSYSFPDWFTNSGEFGLGSFFIPLYTGDLHAVTGYLYSDQTGHKVVGFARGQDTLLGGPGGTPGRFIPIVDRDIAHSTTDETPAPTPAPAAVTEPVAPDIAPAAVAEATDIAPADAVDPKKKKTPKAAAGDTAPAAPDSPPPGPAEDGPAI